MSMATPMCLPTGRSRATGTTVNRGRAGDGFRPRTGTQALKRLVPPGALGVRRTPGASFVWAVVQLERMRGKDGRAARRKGMGEALPLDRRAA